VLCNIAGRAAADCEGLYEDLKTRLIARLAAFNEHQQQPSNDELPSQLLCLLRGIAARPIVTDEVLKIIWMRCLPQELSALLIMPLKIVSMEQLGDIADNLHKELAADHLLPPATAEKIVPDDGAMLKLAELEKRMRALELVNNRPSRPSCRRSRSSSKHRPFGCNRSAWQLLLPRQVW
jgi:hypothetical protein